MLVSIAAFALSPVTSIISVWTAHRKDVHDRQAELATEIQRIQDLTFKEFEVYEKYRGTALETPMLDVIRGQLMSTKQKARELAIRLDAEVTHAELNTLAANAILTGEFSAAKPLLNVAYRNARTSLEITQSLGNLGIVEYRLATNSEDRKLAEERFARALKLDKRDLPFMGKYLDSWVELIWADSIAPFHCDEAKVHFKSAVQALLSLPLDPQAESTRRAALARTEQGFPAAVACRPDKIDGLEIANPPAGPPTTPPAPPANPPRQ